MEVGAWRQEWAFKKNAKFDVKYQVLQCLGEGTLER